MDYTSKNVAVYDQIALPYSINLERHTPIADLEKFISMMPTGAHVLDIGCAAGRDSTYLAKNGCVVTGIDLSDKLLAIAKEKYPHIDFQHMDARDMTFKHEAFDGIWANSILPVLQRRDAHVVLTQAYLLLKPKGVLFMRVKQGEGEAEISDALSGGVTRNFTFYKPKELVEMLEDTGFLIDHLYSIDVGKTRPEFPTPFEISCFAKKY
jgi:2-polyprenyl-3-methyl-5-hydroxy-6-metoxy-1,4-benzoquinol methylase